MRLSELQYKEIINLDGKKIGNIIDVRLDEEGRLISLVLESDKKMFRLKSTDNEIEISWDKIQRIGEDVILVKIWYNISGEIYEKSLYLQQYSFFNRFNI